MTKRRRAPEFSLIERFFRPLTQGQPGALGLADDAALLDIGDGESLVVATDSLVAGVHFFDDDPPGLIARKLLRVNLSDVAAMGAKPWAYLLSIARPSTVDDDWMAAFCAGLALDQETFAVGLIGGDTVATPGALTVTITILARAPSEGVLRRAGARPSDVVFASGTIGDGALGLMARGGGLTTLDEALREAVIERYHLPRPRLDLGRRLRGLAGAAIDVSDGLVGDLSHLCAASGVGAIVTWPRIPLSTAAKAALAGDPALMGAVLGGGDDYELLFTVPAGREADIERLERDLALPLTAIGRIVEGGGVRVLDGAGGEIAVERPGWEHA